MSRERGAVTSMPSVVPTSNELGLAIYRDLTVPMRDGTILHADLWLPAGRTRCPVLLQRTPYDKSCAPVAQGRLDPAAAVARGYGVMIQDVRGRFASGGTFEPFAHELDDGADTIAWIRRQTFSDGRVAMYGASYPGALQLIAAASGVPGLVATVPDVTTVDFHGWMYQGGAFQLGFALSWARNLAVDELVRRKRAGVEVGGLQEALEAALADPWSDYWRLPVADQPILDELVPALKQWLSHPLQDEFWDGLSDPDAIDRIAVPGLHIAGWHDLFVSGTLAGFTRLHRVGHSTQQLLVGPWGHAGWGDAIGEVIYGRGASRYELDPTSLHLDFFDSAVRGLHTARQTPVRLFTMGVNRWRDEDAWPPTGMRTRRQYLRVGGQLTDESPATDEGTRTFRYDPANPVPTTGGATFMPGHEASIALGPRDQRALHARDDVIVYTGEPLAAPVEVTGNVRLTLHAATSAPDTDWTAKLLDVYPDGRAIGITDGIVRARHSHGAPGLLEPNCAHRFQIDIGPTSIVLPAGHRIGIEISSSNFPRFDRNANSRIAPAEARASDMQIATQRLFHDANRPSFLELPVRDG